ncbi:MAG: CRISPR-associated endonuclease Cas1 [Nitrososphaeria archaeon]
MKEPLYLISDGVLFRHSNTLYFINKESGKKPVPVENISDIYCYGNVTVRSGAAMMLMQKGVPVHMFNKHGFYAGSLYPRVQLNSGLVAVKQAENYLDPSKRTEIAAEIVKGIKHNVLQTLKYYGKKGKDVESFIISIEREEPSGDISTIMSSEGRI